MFRKQSSEYTIQVFVSIIYCKEKRTQNNNIIIIKFKSLENRKAFEFMYSILKEIKEDPSNTDKLFSS
jgi:hypothetical protein